MAAVPVIAALSGATLLPLQIEWNMPGGSLSFAMDGLSAFFCLPILLVTPLAALYGCAYLAHEKRRLGPILFFYNTLTASMLLLMTACNGLLFLVLWELMAISSFFLVVFEDEHAHVRQAGWTYIVATHIGTAALLVLFALLGRQASSLDFGLMATARLSPTMAGVLFVLAVIGFGSKAGFVPLHVWLPEAHPAAPSHVSALMSGVMIKTGIYGLLRILTLLGSPPASWGWALVIIGLISGVLGVVFALAQHDLKRLLAYHSVENIGIITLGIGAGLLGLAWRQPVLTVLGFGGGILHVLNHAVFKSLLFLGAGAVAQGTGTRDIDRLGGLIKSMRRTGVTFLVASAAISGLPPFNGFVSDFLIYVSGFSSVRAATPQTVILAIGIAGGLALIGGLAAACFAKAFGVIFLGEPRSDQAAHAKEACAAMRWPMAVLAVLCLSIGRLAPAAIEATTLASAPLIYYHQSRRSLEAAWKYLMLCSVGIALALLGIFFMSMTRQSGPRDLALTVLLEQAGTLNHKWLGTASESSTEALQRILETRLDNVIRRLHWARTIWQAHQMVGHGHFYVNGHNMDRPSYQVEPGDEITVKAGDEAFVRSAIEGTENVDSKIPEWLSVNDDNLTAKVRRLQ